MMVATLRSSLVPALIVALGSLSPASGCAALWGTPPDWVAGADVIVRARAVQLVNSVSTSRPTWKTKIRFEAVEVIKGTVNGAELAFEGAALDRNDWNRLPVPYTMVRPGGRSGNCYAFNYRLGQEYLLMLKRVDGALTPYWASLAATNEQLSGPADKWLVWVRQAVQAKQPGRV